MYAGFGGNSGSGVFLYDPGHWFSCSSSGLSEPTRLPSSSDCGAGIISASISLTNSAGLFIGDARKLAAACQKLLSRAAGAGVAAGVVGAGALVACCRCCGVDGAALF